MLILPVTRIRPVNTSEAKLEPTTLAASKPRSIEISAEVMTARGTPFTITAPFTGAKIPLVGAAVGEVKY